MRCTTSISRPDAAASRGALLLDAPARPARARQSPLPRCRRALGRARPVPEHELALDAALLGPLALAASPDVVGAELPRVGVVGEAALERVEEVVAEHRRLDRGG